MITVRRKQAHRETASSFAVSEAARVPTQDEHFVSDLIVDNIGNALIVEQARRFEYVISETMPRTELSGEDKYR
ncbi:hypothetical protein AMS69_09095 [Haloarcula rubripromontorii]|uniref:Uncharacterized protein n=1 Tax=Haloarcula rubripromontorii TaxID=1705562 RepID=A0A0M9AKR7_9EURY|nr:hypothetical protein AMS69_09095 [Haloarcula rubripromontorii]